MARAEPPTPSGRSPAGSEAGERPQPTRPWRIAALYFLRTHRLAQTDTALHPSWHPMTESLDRLTTALRDHYAIDRQVGEGGMATVYLARDLKHDRAVAIKVLRPELAATIGTDRFLREIEMAARLQHPHVLAVYDSGAADGVLYYVMPYVEGESLIMAIQELAVSSGSACTSASLEPSYVLRALGRNDELAHSSIRFTLGRFTTQEEIDFAVQLLASRVGKLRDMSPLWEMAQDGIDLNSVEWAAH